MRGMKEDQKENLKKDQEKDQKRETLKKRAEKYLYGILVGLLFLVFLATRFWRVTSIPSGINIDEAATTYSAWCLAHYGVDRYLKSWPVYLLNFGAGQSILYGYLLAGLFRIFDYNVLLIRFPGILFSFLNWLFGMLIVRKLYPGNKYLSLIAGGLITICPYFIMAGRFGLDCNLMLGMSTVFLYCFICAMDSGRYGWYAAAGLTGGLVLYTYAISYIAVPVFLVICFLYTLWTKKFSFKKWAVMGIPLGILAFPLLLEQYINAFDKEEIRLGIFTVTKMAYYRGSEIEHMQWKHFLNALHSIFCYDNLRFNSLPQFLTLYNLTIPLVILGLLYVLWRICRGMKNREHMMLFYPLGWFAAMLLVLSCFEANVNRCNGIFYAVIFLAVSGVHLILQYGKKFGAVIVACVGVCYVVWFARFGSYYYLGTYTAENQPLDFFDVTVTEAIQFLEENPQYRNERTYMAEPPLYLALSTFKSPYDMKIYEDGKLLYWDYYYCNALPGIQEGCNYIVRDVFVDFAEQLRSLGYKENRYVDYSLFYKENNE